jgi:hypothetical protein
MTSPFAPGKSRSLAWLLLAPRMLAGCAGPVSAPVSTPPGAIVAAPIEPTVTPSSPEAVTQASRCRPEVRGSSPWAPAIALALEELFSRVVDGHDGSDWLAWTEGRYGHAPAEAHVVAAVQRLHACPRYFEIHPEDTAGVASGLLVFEEPELGSLRAGFVRGWPPDPGRVVLHLSGFEHSFRAARARAVALPFLERMPEWIPSVDSSCAGTDVVLLRGSRANVLCAQRDEKARCFAFDASPGGPLSLDVDADGLPSPSCAVDTRTVIGPDLDLRIASPRPRQSPRRRPIGHVGAEAGRLRRGSVIVAPVGAPHGEPRGGARDPRSARVVEARR